MKHTDRCWFKMESTALTALIAVVALTVLMCGNAFAQEKAADKQAYRITRKQALQTALDDAGLTRSQVRSVEVEKERGIFEIEFTAKGEGTEYEYEIAVANGLIIDTEKEYPHKLNTSRDKIGKKAAQRAVARFSGFSLKTVQSGSCTYKKDRREWVYKIRFHKGRYKYKYEVLAPTGMIIEMEKEFRK